MDTQIASHVRDSHVPRHMSKSNEWYTPSKFIGAVWDVLEYIELDPASCEAANETVQATRFYTQEQNGLLLPWKSPKVFLNPPYGRINHRSSQEVWMCRLLDEYERGNVGEAILLVNSATETGWFQRLWKYPICFVRGRIHFDGPNSKEGPTHGSVFVYFGNHPERFREVFSTFGEVK